MHVSKRIISAFLFSALAAIAQDPQLTKGLSAMNAASYIPAGLPSYGVAPGARFVVLKGVLEGLDH